MSPDRALCGYLPRLVRLHQRGGGHLVRVQVHSEGDRRKCTFLLPPLATAAVLTTRCTGRVGVGPEPFLHRHDCLDSNDHDELALMRNAARPRHEHKSTTTYLATTESHDPLYQSEDLVYHCYDFDPVYPQCVISPVVPHHNRDARALPFNPCMMDLRTFSGIVNNGARWRLAVLYSHVGAMDHDHPRVAFLGYEEGARARVSCPWDRGRRAAALPSRLTTWKLLPDCHLASGLPTYTHTSNTLHKSRPEPWRAEDTCFL